MEEKKQEIILWHSHTCMSSGGNIFHDNAMIRGEYFLSLGIQKLVINRHNKRNKSD